MYVALEVFPRNKFKAPEVPGWADAVKPGNCQHLSIELPFTAAMAVRFSDGVVRLVNWAETCSRDEVESKMLSVSLTNENGFIVLGSFVI